MLLTLDSLNLNYITRFHGLNNYFNCLYILFYTSNWFYFAYKGRARAYIITCSRIPIKSGLVL